MGKVVAGGTVSLDGYIAGPNESGFEHSMGRTCSSRGLA
jgi:hypothetical protein